MPAIHVDLAALSSTTTDCGQLNPKLSVVIASINGGASLADCLASIFHQSHGDEIEIVVSESSGNAAIEKTCAQYPNARILHFDERKTIPELRAAGLLNARGDILAMTEDHCIAGDHWIENMLRAHASPHSVIGGAVENAATERLIDWAVFFCEYGRYMLPLTAGITSDLPGPNVSYKRLALNDFRDLLTAPTWETFWHSRLKSRGAAMFREPRLIVYHRKNFTLRAFMRERFHYARSFAGQRVRGASWAHRAIYVCGAPFLSPLLLMRIVTQVLGKGRKRLELFLTLPYLILFTLAWSLGEFVGYLAGAGESLNEIE